MSSEDKNLEIINENSCIQNNYFNPLSFLSAIAKNNPNTRDQLNQLYVKIASNALADEKKKAAINEYPILLNEKRFENKRLEIEIEKRQREAEDLLEKNKQGLELQSLKSLLNHLEQTADTNLDQQLEENGEREVTQDLEQPTQSTTTTHLDGHNNFSQKQNKRNFEKMTHMISRNVKNAKYILQEKGASNFQNDLEWVCKRPCSLIMPINKKKFKSSSHIHLVFQSNTHRPCRSKYLEKTQNKTIKNEDKLKELKKEIENLKNTYKACIISPGKIRMQRI